MKNILLLTLLCLTASLVGQIRQDTVFNRWGQIANIKHFSKMDTEKVSKATLFMRGLTVGDDVWQIDSISSYNDEGKFIRTRNISEMDAVKDTHIPRKNRLPIQVDEEPQGNHIKKHLSIVDLVHISGYAGTKAEATINFLVLGEEDLSLQLINKPANIGISSLSKAFSPGSHELTLTVEMRPGVYKQTLRMQGPDKETYDIHLALRGHDLTEEDLSLIHI